MKSIEYSTNRNSCYLLHAALVVTTKSCKPVFAYPPIENYLWETVFNNIKGEWGCEVDNIIIKQDHFILLFYYKPQICLSKLVNNLKTVTSRRVRKMFPKHMNGIYPDQNCLWNNSYLVCTGSETEMHMIMSKYILDQRLKGDM